MRRAVYVGGGRILGSGERSVSYGLWMHEEPDTQELKALQLQREAEEQELAESAPDEPEFAQHERRAEKARYLLEKLEERAASERTRRD
jgi:hypothetical protein